MQLAKPLHLYSVGCVMSITQDTALYGRVGTIVEHSGVGAPAYTIALREPIVGRQVTLRRVIVAEADLKDAGAISESECRQRLGKLGFTLEQHGATWRARNTARSIETARVSERDDGKHFNYVWEMAARLLATDDTKQTERQTRKKQDNKAAAQGELF